MPEQARPRPKSLQLPQTADSQLQSHHRRRGRVRAAEASQAALDCGRRPGPQQGQEDQRQDPQGQGAVRQLPDVDELRHAGQSQAEGRHLRAD